MITLLRVWPQAQLLDKVAYSRRTVARADASVLSSLGEALLGPTPCVQVSKR